MTLCSIGPCGTCGAAVAAYSLGQIKTPHVGSVATAFMLTTGEQLPIPNFLAKSAECRCQGMLEMAQRGLPFDHLRFLQLLPLIQGVFSENSCSIEAHMGGWGRWGGPRLAWIQRQLLC